MQEETRGLCDSIERGCNCCNNSGVFGRIFNGGNDTEILFFIIIFLLLFTSFGNCGRNC